MGNHKWTFGLTGKHAFRFPRFVLVAVSCFILNQALLYQLVEIAQWDYRLGLGIVVFVVPLTSFAMNRIWVFREKTKADDLL
jgi:putative flippase GtrA